MRTRTLFLLFVVFLVAVACVVFVVNTRNAEMSQVSQQNVLPRNYIKKYVQAGLTVRYVESHDAGSKVMVYSRDAQGVYQSNGLVVLDTDKNKLANNGNVAPKHIKLFGGSPRKDGTTAPVSEIQCKPLDNTYDVFERLPNGSLSVITDARVDMLIKPSMRTYTCPVYEFLDATTPAAKKSSKVLFWLECSLQVFKDEDGYELPLDCSKRST
jgi:hypothetical protein